MIKNVRLNYTVKLPKKTKDLHITILVLVTNEVLALK